MFKKNRLISPFVIAFLGISSLPLLVVSCSSENNDLEKKKEFVNTFLNDKINSIDSSSLSLSEQGKLIEANDVNKKNLLEMILGFPTLENTDFPIIYDFKDINSKTEKTDNKTGVLYFQLQIQIDKNSTIASDWSKTFTISGFKPGLVENYYANVIESVVAQHIKNVMSVFDNTDKDKDENALNIKLSNSLEVQIKALISEIEAKISNYNQNNPETKISVLDKIKIYTLASKKVLKDMPIKIQASAFISATVKKVLVKSCISAIKELFKKVLDSNQQAE